MKIVYICHISNSEIRSHLRLKNLLFENILRRLCNKEPVIYSDLADWNEQFINVFKKDTQNEYFIISHHYGMIQEYQSYVDENIHFTFIREERPLLLKSFFYFFDEKNIHSFYRRRINKKITEIKPDLVIVCGAENPIYSAVILDLKTTGIPLFVILQTLLNSPKRIQMNVGSPYRRWLESEILQNTKNFGTSDDESIKYLREKYPSCKIYNIHFPSTPPAIAYSADKKFDFVFFARGISKFKGIEDAIIALSKVVLQYPTATMQVIGSCEMNYKNYLVDLIKKSGVESNVIFSGYCSSKEDVYKLVQKSKFIIVPGITASLNSTIREGMFMSMPVICYESAATKEINSRVQCLFSANKEDVEDLAKSMIFVLQNPEYAHKVAQNGYKYALSNFSGDAIEKELKFAINDILKNGQI